LQTHRIHPGEPDTVRVTVIPDLETFCDQLCCLAPFSRMAKITTHQKERRGRPGPFEFIAQQRNSLRPTGVLIVTRLFSLPVTRAHGPQTIHVHLKESYRTGEHVSAAP
jgi:hypothetical protein